MAACAPTRPALSARDLSPSIFAIVMATGIVSLALNGAGWLLLARGLFWLNVALYAILGILLAIRAVRYRAHLVADFRSHARAPGFFTLVAAPCVLGNQCVLQFEVIAPGLALWIVGVLFWLALTYVMLPGLMESQAKPKLAEGLNGAWLLVVVGTQAVSVLATLLVPAFAPDAPERLLFVALAFWLVGSMLYMWLIVFIFHRILFLSLAPGDLTPPYWINMGAMAISTLAGACLVGDAGRSPVLADLLPFLKGTTLLFWATATWWIPILLVLGVWRHLLERDPLIYEHDYWAVVFPLGMYAVCTQTVIRAFSLPLLEPIAEAFVWIALGAWALTLVGLARYALIACPSRGPVQL